MSATPLQIGRLQLETNLLLAPIAGHCDLATRLIARSCGGVGLACTDLLSPEGLLRGTPGSLALARTCRGDSPLCMQLYGADAERLCEAARWAEDHGAAVVDLNMGCPVDKVTKKDGGSKLLCDPDRTLRIVQRLVAAVRRVPFTCKMRLGWDDSCIVAPYLAERLEAIGVSAVTIHGRTTEMRFSGTARLDGIAAVVAAVRRIPVIGNGDVRSPQDALTMIRKTGCAGVMIGRAALSQPWIFRDTWSYLTTGVVPPPLSVYEKAELMRRHFELTREFRGDRSAVIEFRKRVSWYSKTMHPCEMLKEGLRLMETPAQFHRTLDAFIEFRRRREQGGVENEISSYAAA